MSYPDNETTGWRPPASTCLLRAPNSPDLGGDGFCLGRRRLGGRAAPGAAKLDATSVPAKVRHEASLTVAAFGRYAVTVTSAQGTALQLVDRMAEPGEVQGKAGEEDGRLEAFLDRDEYKVVTLGDEQGGGEAMLSMYPFAEKNGRRPPLVFEGKPVATALADFEQVSFWLRIEDHRRVVFDAAGRNLADVRLWRGGTWLADLSPERQVIEPAKGRPLLDCRLAAELDAGYYVLTAVPQQKGILDLALRPIGLVDLALGVLGKQGEVKQTPVRAAAHFSKVTLEADRSYTVYLNDQSGVVLRPLPLDLTEPLPVAQQPGEAVSVPFTVSEAARLSAQAEDGTFLEMAVDGGAWQRGVAVEAGTHTASVRSSGDQTVVYSLQAAPVRLLAETALPEVGAADLAAPPKLPVLAPGTSQFLDLERGGSASLLVRAARAALYRLESTGLLAAEGNLRTRTVLSLDRQSASGVGWNSLIRQYLREGDYQLTASVREASAGHLGVALRRTPIGDGGKLAAGQSARVTLPDGEGVMYGFHVTTAGDYRLNTLVLARSYRCRLVDADGWPVEPPNIAASLNRHFDAGDYRLVLLPEDVTTRRVTLLEKVEEGLRFTGHGPHVLPLDRELDYLWQESPEGVDRVPDTWEFARPAPGNVRVALSGVARPRVLANLPESSIGWPGLRLVAAAALLVVVTVSVWRG